MCIHLLSLDELLHFWQKIIIHLLVNLKYIYNILIGKIKTIRISNKNFFSELKMYITMKILFIVIFNSNCSDVKKNKIRRHHIERLLKNAHYVHAFSFKFF